ncbi:ankyrin repeat-containing domain protein [Colletotrichum lupini]|nr:ankyrin repeat-containing domain protein [Colletotrichum lupini]
MTWLLEQGANPNCPYGKNSSIVGTMISQTCLNTGLQATLERYTATGGSFMNEPECLVATAVKANNEEGLKILLDHLKANRKSHAKQVGAGSSDVLALAVNRKWQGTTPLHWAASMNNVSTVQLLIDSGADLEATDDKGWTPLLVSIKAPATFDLSAVVRALLESGSDPKCRDNNGVTPIAEACTQGNPRVISALMDRGPDVHVEDYAKRNVLHRLFTRDETDETNVARPALFIKLTRMGVNPHKLDMFGCSALHLSIFHKSMVALLLNGDLQIQDERPIPWSTMFLGRDATNEAAACLTTAFRMYRRKLSTEKLRTLLNLEAGGFWNPLSFAASRGQIQVMKNILSLGIPIDFEGCPEGSALMAASSAGVLKSVIYLVRHGASISFQGNHNFRSAVKLAATSPRVLRRLLVDRFTDQKKLDQSCHASTSPSTDYKPWSGIQKAEMIISGRWERQPHESSQQYWARLSNMTEDFRGKFLPPNGGKTTRRQSKLVPSESVRIAADGYFVPYDASVGERVTRKSKWSELSLEVRECLERFCL